MEGDPPADQRSPTKVGKYELRKVVGRGSIGIVYEGWDGVLRRIVAVKTLHLIELDTALGQEKYQRFQREAQAAARLYHPNIAITFDYGEIGALAYIVMEFLEGPSLRELIERGRIDIDQIKLIMQGLLAGLQHSHEQGVVHRDIKPANVLFNKGNHVKITDFGIARLDDSDLTQLGSQVGTPAYMSPEQVLGDTADARSDIYSAGVVLFELLTGHRPFEGSTNSVMHKILHSPAPRVSESTAEFSPAVDAVVAKALAKEQKDRYQTANEFWNALNTSLLSVRSSDITTIIPEPSLESTILHANRPATAAPALETATAIMPARRTRSGALTSAAIAACLALSAVVWWSVHKPTGGPAPGSSSVTRADKVAPAVHKRVAATSIAPAPPAPAAQAAPDHPATSAPATRAARSPAESQSAAANLAPQRSDLLASLGGTAARVPCSFVTVQIGDGNAVILNGVTALGEASEVEIRGIVRQSVAQLAPTAPVTWNVRRVEGPFCPIFDLLHPLPTTGQGLVISVADSSAAQSTDGTATGQIRAAMPGFPGVLIMDAYSPDGLVHHLYPGSAGAQMLPAGTKVSVSLPVPGMTNKNASDQRPNLLVAIASSSALLNSSRPANEPMAGYLKDLDDALARGRASGTSVLADATGIGPGSSK